jgi:hypothetical protein
MHVFCNLLKHNTLIEIFPIRKFAKNTFLEIVNFCDKNIVNNSKRRKCKWLTTSNKAKIKIQAKTPVQSHFTTSSHYKEIKNTPFCQTIINHNINQTFSYKENAFQNLLTTTP